MTEKKTKAKAKSLYMEIKRQSSQVDTIKIKAGEEHSWLPYVGDVVSVKFVEK